MIVGSPSLGSDPADSERYEHELRDLAAELPVTWMAAQRDVIPLIQSVDVAVAPSLWPEPLSRSVMEPLACGVPVVATRVGGNPEILTGWLAQYLVEPGDVDGLAERILAVIGWRRLDEGLGTRLRRHAEEHLSLDAETAAVQAALATAAAAGQPARRRRRASPSDAASCG